MKDTTTERLTENLTSLLVRTRTKNPDRPNIRFFDISLDCCDWSTHYVCLRCHTYSWMANSQNDVHGGMIATIFDHCMGIVCRAVYEVLPGKPLPTTSIAVNYARPVPVGKDILVRIHIVSTGKSVAHFTAEMSLPDAPHFPLATAVSTFHTVLVAN